MLDYLLETQLEDVEMIRNTDSKKSADKITEENQEEIYKALQDQDFIEDLIDSLQGVDKNDIDIQVCERFRWFVNSYSIV